MKQLLFLLLFPCLALAQYQGNANQKITLGEQTTADGLVFRGVASIDTVTATSKITRANKQDTSAYLLLDTVTNLLWHYKIGSNAWTQAGGGVSVSSFSAGTTGLTPSTATTGAVTLGGTLAVANGGTNTSTAFTAGSVVFAGTSGTYTQDNSNLFWDDTYNRLGIGTTSPSSRLEILNGNGDTRMTITSTGNTGSSDFSLINSTGTVSYDWLFQALGSNGNFRIFDNAGASTGERFSIDQYGNVGIGTASPAVQFHTTGGVRFAGLASITDLRTDANGDLFNGSDFNLKNSIDTINFGLSDVLKLKPVSFNWNDEQRNINEYKSMGFIAQDVMNIIPNAASTMGDGNMQVDYNAIVATLTKAIQEQNTIIKALEQRIINLENK